MLQKRKAIGQRNGLKIYKRLVAKSKLKAKTKLKSHKPMKQITEKQKKINANWKEITDAKCERLNYICQWCGQVGTRSFDDFNRLEGHHIIGRRANIHTEGNCFIAHNVTCHDFITDHSIDVRIYPNKEVWEKRNG